MLMDGISSYSEKQHENILSYSEKQIQNIFWLVLSSNDFDNWFYGIVRSVYKLFFYIIFLTLEMAALISCHQFKVSTYPSIIHSVLFLHLRFCAPLILFLCFICCAILIITRWKIEETLRPYALVAKEEITQTLQHQRKLIILDDNYF